MIFGVQNWFARSRWAAGMLAASALLIAGASQPSFAAGTVHQVTVVMNEFKFEPATIHLKAGETVALTIKNEGSVEHEWSAGRNVVDNTTEKGYRTDLWALLKPRVTGKKFDVEKVSATPSKSDEAESETAKMLSNEVDVQPGGSVTLRFTVPANAKGTWQFGCFAAGHYESGMKGTLVID